MKDSRMLFDDRNQNQQKLQHRCKAGIFDSFVKSLNLLILSYH